MKTFIKKILQDPELFFWSLDCFMLGALVGMLIINIL